MPVLRGEKTERSVFRRGVNLVHRGDDAGPKALQAGTSHFLGQNFSKACGIKFQGVRAKRIWMDDFMGGVDPLIGGMIMTHADDDGVVVPPKVAPTPRGDSSGHMEESREQVLEACRELATD